MRNYDAIIAVLGLVMFILGWIASSINYNHRIKSLKAEINKIKEESNKLYTAGWYAGYDHLLAEPETMRAELKRADAMKRAPK